MDPATADTADSSTRALSMLALISAELNSQMTLEEVTAAVLHAALALNDATVAAVATLDGAGSVTIASLSRDRLPTTDGLSGGSGMGAFDVHRGLTGEIRSAVEHTRPVAIDDLPPGVISGCLHSGASSWLRDLSEDTVLGEVDQALGHPVRDETGGVVAVLAVGWITDIGFGPEIRAVTELFCDLTGSGLVRARRAEELSDLANQMRTALLPATVTDDRLDVAFDYVPALNTIGFGGDWFDIVEPETDRTVLVVGDIAGHGVPAAARMALAQGTVSALSQCTAINEIPLIATRSLTGGNTEMLATLGLIDVDLADMTIDCQLAGHPPPMLRRPDGSVLRLGGTPLPPIGMVDTAGERDNRTPVTPGCMVVLYSDGLIERRGADLAERLTELEAIIAGLASDVSAAEALETICTGMLTDASEDDVAILVVRLQGPDT